jgi:ubiquinone/menaquinone biosynthesis C-methylase UbiE
MVYDELMVRIMFEPWARVLVDVVGIERGDAILDVACGPGTVARVAASRAGPGGRVVGCDLSEPMLEAARTKPAVEGGARIEYRQGPADLLPVTDGEFDVATCQQGLQFFPDRVAALAEIHRALCPGGRVGIAVWARIERSPPFAALADGVEEVCGEELANRYRGGPFGFPDAEHLRQALEAARFEEVAVTGRVVPIAFESGPAQVVTTLAATPLAEEIERLPDEHRQRLISAVGERIGSGPIHSTLEANIAVAHR